MADALPGALPADVLSRLGSARSLLDLIDLTGATREDLDAPTPRRHYSGTVRPADIANLTFDPASGSFGVKKKDGTGTDVTDGGDPDSWLSFPDPTISFDLIVETDPTHTNATGPFDLKLTLPAAVLSFPQLRGAKLDSQGLLVEDTEHVKVRFHLPRLVLRIQRAGTTGDPGTSIESASGDPNIYEFCRMEPPHALIGPGSVLGFTFRAAILDLSEATNPPAPAKSIPAAWQGIFIPEARIYVAPSGLEDLAIAAGVQDLWIGIGRHKGVTGTFELDVVNRGTFPQVRVRFHDAGGRWIGTSGIAPNFTAELPETTTIMVDAAGGIAPYTTSISVGGVVTTGTRATVTTPSAGSVSIDVTVTDNGAHPSIVHVIATRRATPMGPVPGEGTKRVVVTGTGAQRIVERGQDDVSIELSLADATGTITWDAPASPTSGATTHVPVAAGSTVNVTAHRHINPTEPITLTSFFHYDHPKSGEDGTSQAQNFNYSSDPDKTHSTKAVNESDAGWTANGTPIKSSPQWQALATLPAGSHVDIEGFASYDGYNDSDAIARNQSLSKRRAEGLAHLLAQLPNLVVNPVTFRGFDASFADQAAGRPTYWKAVATYKATAPIDETLTAVLRRDATADPPLPVTPTDPEPARPGFPDWFHRVGLKMRLERSDVVLLEINGEIDIRTAAERSLASNDPQATLPPPTNPNDGISQFVLRLDLDRTSSDWKVTAAFKAIDADTDGLWKIERAPANLRGVNTLGAYAALGPILAAVAPASPASGDVVPLVLASGAATGLALADVLKTKHVILHGGELVVSHGSKGTDYVVLLDLETAIGFDASVIKVDLTKPITTRYKALGLKLGDRDGGAFQARPMFDPSRGYSLDIPEGAVVAAGPLADILKILGAKVSKDNPTYLEVEVGLGADLGIVTVDRARVRLRLDQPPNELPSLTALGATIDVPGAFTGRGYMQVTPTGLTGFFDLAIAPPIGIRASAGLKIEHTPDGVFGVFIGVRLELPAPIPLGTSGLGIFGFAAGLGANMGRTPAASPLAWLAARINHDALDPTGWQVKPGGWAFAVGATLGTVDGFILRMQGLVMLELPGPRVLILMKARILLPPTSPDDFPILAVIDISPDALTIGLLAEYSFASIVKLRVPVRLFFNFHDAEDWSFDLGTFSDPVVVSVLDVFRGTGYFMMHGKGISPMPPAFSSITTRGITLAVGFHVEFIWGSTSIGLYAKVAGGFDALVSIDPVFVAGTIEVSGELRLFIISIGASAKLDAETDGDKYHIHGEICGKVSFFFFDVEGCVDFTLNSPVNKPHIPPPLVDGVVLVSRSPALVEGSGSDAAIDGVLTKAHQVGIDPPAQQPDPVPLDAFPVIQFAVTPVVPAAFKVLGAPPLSVPGTGPNAWVQRGAEWWRYELRSVDFTPVPTGKTPTTWWSRKPVVDPQEGTRLALLSWLPTSAPRAVPYGEHLDTMVHDAWGGTCQPPADASPTLYTFDRQAIGESTTGWSLQGTMWPDAAGTYRSDSENTALRITERWRCGDAEADGRRGVNPADVVGGHVRCTDSDPTMPTMQQLASGSTGPSGISMLTASSTLVAATELLANGVRPREIYGTVTGGKLFRDQKGCDGRVLRSPEHDTLEPAPFGDQDDEKAVKEAWEKTGFRPAELLDGIELHTGEVPYVTILLAGTRNAFHGSLAFQFIAADGSILEQQRIDHVSTTGLGGLPGRWWDPAGPWRDPVQRAGELLANIASTDQLLLAFATLKPPAKTNSILVGVTRENRDKPGFEPFYLAAIELVTEVERRRHDFDEHVQTTVRDTLTTVLSTEVDDYALLVPGQPYTVSVGWEAFFVEGAARPGDTTPGTPTGLKTQTFTFAAQNKEQVPVRLDPWVLDTDPGDHEGAAFCDDPVRLSFATQNVVRLFQAYGYEIRLVLHGASGRHPNVGAPPTTGSPPLAHALNPSVVGTAGLRITTPWEEAVRSLAAEELPCIAPGTRDEHISVVLPFPLDANTDYLVDLMLEPTGGGTSTLAYRHGFTTSRFRTLSEFASSVRDVVVEHRSVPSPAALSSLSAKPAGDAIDSTFAAAGMDPLGVPRLPRMMVLWNTAAPPQPVAVVIDANEPLWRRRQAPAIVPQPPEPPDPRDLSGHHWALRPYEWLALNHAGTAVVGTTVEAPGGQRAIVMLTPNQRGTTLKLSLDRRNDPVTGTGATSASLGGILLDRAPWEEEA